MPETNDLSVVTKQIETLVREIAAATQKRQPIFFDIPKDAKQRYVIFDPVTNKYTTETPIAGYADFKLEQPGELQKFVEEHKDDADVTDPAIFYNTESIVFIYNEKDRGDKATCDLVTSTVWDQLFAGPPLMDQRSFINFLRITLRNCIMQGPGLLNLVRTIKFAGTSGMEGNIQHGNESLGKSITNQVTGQDAFPEEVLLSIPIFENFQRSYQVPCALIIEPAIAKFQLTPYPLVMQMAMDQVLLDIAAVFGDDDMPPIYRGQP